MTDKGKLLRPTEAAALLNRSRVYFYRLAKRPDFPVPIILSGARGRMWYQGELEEWAEAQREKRTA